MTVQVNHVEIPVPNLMNAKKFFDTVFGWDMDIESMGGSYGLVDIKDATSLGFPVKEKIPEFGIHVIFGVENIEATLKEIEANGGKIHKEKYVITPEIGYAAEFLDCFGNWLGLFAPPE
ncbi:MAG: VOC family protein [Candidatus Kariarchaeaceae archaeon]|jgi:predicted enzyme related to lactoylglutathione lyase